MTTKDAKENTTTMVKSDPALSQIEQMIGQNKAHMAGLLGNRISTERLFNIAMLSVSRVPRLSKCTTASVLGCVMESSRLRLAAGVGPGGTWLIPRENKHLNALECTLIIDYRAIILMMQRDAGVGPVIAEAVHKNDPFRYGVRSDGPFLEWEPAPHERGPIIGYVAASWSKADRRLTGVIYKTVEEIKKSHLAKSPAGVKGEGPWATDPEWMYKKSVIRPLGKLNPGTENDDLSRAIAIDERADLGLPQNLHLLADPNAKPQLDAPEGAKPTPPPTAAKGEKPKPEVIIAWARDASGKQGVPAAQFDAWLALQPGDEAAKAAAAEVAWKTVAAKKATANDVFAVAEKNDAAPTEQEARFQVTGHATTDIEGDPDWYSIKDGEEPANKYITKDEAIFDAAKDAKKNDNKLAVVWIPKVVGKNTLRLIVRRIA